MSEEFPWAGLPDEILNGDEGDEFWWAGLPEMGQEEEPPAPAATGPARIIGGGFLGPGGMIG